MEKSGSDTPVLYPECEKLRVVAPVSQQIGEFVDWLAEEHGIYLADYTRSGRLYATRKSVQDLLAEFFEIDMVKVEKERRQILETI